LVPNNIRAINFLTRANNPINPTTSGLIGIPIRDAEVTGDAYLFSDWRKSAIVLFENDKLIENNLTRFDLLNKRIEIKFNNKTQAIEGKLVKSFAIADSITNIPKYFINGKDYHIKEETRFDGFLEVLSEGDRPLFKYQETFMKDPDYNMTLNIGNIDYKIIKKTLYFTLEGEKLIPIPNQTRRLVELFPEGKDNIIKFIKINEIRLSKEHHLIGVFDFYNNNSEYWRQ
jgi:hypothetical protein